MTQHNTTQHKHAVHTTNCLTFTSHKHTNSEPHTVPSIQYMYETTLLELFNCAILCSLTTVIGRFILHELQMVKLQEEKQIYRTFTLTQKTGNALAKMKAQTKTYTKGPMESVNLYTLWHSWTTNCITRYKQAFVQCKPTYGYAVYETYWKMKKWY